MANRAYLYVSNTEGDHRFWERDDPPESWYYDSRHNVPPAWLFFFATSDVRLVPVDRWHEVLVVAPRQEAVERFRLRQPLLRSLLGVAVGWHWVEGFMRDIAQTEGTNLVMDPDELWQGDAAIADRLRAVLCELDRPPPAGSLLSDAWHREVYEPHADP